MKRLDSGIPKIEKLIARPSNAQIATETSVNYEKVLQAKHERFKPKYIRSDFNKHSKRDDAMFKLGDWWTNTQLENTKEERELQLKNKSS